MDSQEFPPLEILFQDEHLVVINKPNGLLVHKSSIATNTSTYALQLLRDQLNQKVYPCHRLDRKTSGILVFALSKEVQKLVNDQFMNNLTKKTYVAIVRGFTDASGTIDYELMNEKGVAKQAITHYQTLATIELPIPLGKFATSRYSMVEIKPVTGRMHQIRRHFAHIFHPIIGDRPHGCNKQNKLFLERWNFSNLLLHALKLEFEHPITNQRIILKANLPEEFLRMQKELGLD